MIRKRAAFILAVMLWFGSLSVFADTPAAELPLPVIPDTITRPEQRADYLTEHFWDAMDFSKAYPGADAPLIEQTFVNFLSVFPHAGSDAINRGIAKLLAEAATNPPAYSTLRNIAEKYLYEPDSPMLSEEYYLLFIEAFEASGKLGEVEKARMEAQKEAIEMNRPGSPAPDFVFNLRDGSETTLYSLPLSGDILLIFYDPACENCEETIEYLRNDASIEKMINEKALSIVAVYSGTDRRNWERSAPQMPETWIVGYEPDTIEEDNIFDFRTMPTIYLLDNDRVIKDKELRPQAIRLQAD